MRRPDPEPDPAKDQPYMTNPETVKRIVELACLKENDVVLEIGAGSGILTERLAAEKARVIAVEVDRRFASTLGRLRQHNLEIVYANALDVMDGIGFNKIVSNIPYSICEPLLGKLARREFELAVLSVPENFASILAAKPGAKKYSILSLRAACFFSIEEKFRIPAADFDPVPDTGSVAVVMKPLSRDEYGREPWKFVGREIFLQKKRKLRNALTEALINLDKRIFGRNSTKRLAREAIGKMRLGRKPLDMDVGSMQPEDFEMIRKAMRFNAQNVYIFGKR